MFGARTSSGKRLKDEAEKPFWISFADLMTALMVMFLLVMSVALLAVTKSVSEEQRAGEARQDAINRLLDQIEMAVNHDPNFHGIRVDRDRHVIDFGDRARFDTASHQLNKDQARLLRAFIPTVLDIANSDLGRDWLKRIVAEGFADQRGSYLFNLNLSLQRSQRVLCVLLGPPEPGESPLNPAQHEDIRQLFLVGGYSSNSQKATLEESRRIELRLEFRGLKEPPRVEPAIPDEHYGTCAL
jgi:outer membrane protein OmpA-like peptidoglycan-associated protein